MYHGYLYQTSKNYRYSSKCKRVLQSVYQNRISQFPHFVHVFRIFTTYHSIWWWSGNFWIDHDANTKIMHIFENIFTRSFRSEDVECELKFLLWMFYYEIVSHATSYHISRYTVNIAIRWSSWASRCKRYLYLYYNHWIRTTVVLYNNIL